MRQSSIIIHKGKREEKYEIYIEDYVMSFLKEETGSLDLAELYFYGFRENNKRYIIYGVGRDKGLPVFDKYSLLAEIGCRLTQAGPVFLVREENDIYEIKGYDIFYQDNKEMQSYLIDRQRESLRDDKSDKENRTVRSIYADEVADKESDNQRAVQNTAPLKSPHSAVSVQLGIILVALIAIVINSTNSYDKLTQLNQSASEVFFAIENQEAEVVPETDGGRDEIVVERNAAKEEIQSYEPDVDAAVSDSEQQEDVLKLVALENEEQAEALKNGDLSEETAANEDVEDPGADGATQQESTEEDPEASETAQQEENSGEDSAEQEGVEALSRNVARYYEVERGDTLYTISRKIYGDITYVERICELNRISNPDHIRYGQKIILP